MGDRQKVSRAVIDEEEALEYENRADVVEHNRRKAEQHRLTALFDTLKAQDCFSKGLTTFDVTDWPRDASGDYVCHKCIGYGRHTFPVLKGETEARWVFCSCCGGTGKLVMALMFELTRTEREKKGVEDEVAYFKSFVKRTSTCKTCGGNQMKTPGLMQCKECGLEGMCSWGG